MASGRSVSGQAFFVTGSGTDIGKSWVTAGLLRAFARQGWPVHALKPVMSGLAADRLEESDAGVLLAAMGRPATADAVAAIAPWRFAAPLSPDMAARREGRSINVHALVDFCRAEAKRAQQGGQVLLIEGVGGVMVPLERAQTVLDWLAATALPALLVVGSYLSALSRSDR
jgi:dethiobiotin synthetase